MDEEDESQQRPSCLDYIKYEEIWRDHKKWDKKDARDIHNAKKLFFYKMSKKKEQEIKNIGDNKDLRRWLRE